MNVLEKYLLELSNVKVSMVGGGVIIRDKENIGKQLLLIQRSHTDHYPDVWEFSRGHCLVNENLSKCIIREIKEETGLDVIVDKYIDTFKYLNSGKRILNIQKNYLCIVKDPKQEVKLSFEHQAYKWISTIGEAELLLPPELKKIVVQVFNKDKSQVVYPKRLFSNEIVGE